MFVTYLQNSSSTGSVPQGPWSSVLYVDNVRGNDVTAQRGNDNLPFATIQAALNAMLTGDLALLAPQTFTLLAPLTVPASVIRGAVYGSPQGGLLQGATPSGPRTALTVGPGVAAQFNLGTNLGLSYWAIGAMQIGWGDQGVGNSPTVANIIADGSEYAVGTFLNTLALDSVSFYDTAPAALTAKYVRSPRIHNCQYGAGLSFIGCGSTFVEQTQMASCVTTYLWDATDPLSVLYGGYLYVYNGSKVGSSFLTRGVTLQGQAGISVDATSEIGGLRGSGLSVSGTRASAIRLQGYVGAAFGATIDFASAGAELPDTTVAMVLDLRGARFFTNNGSTPAGVLTAKFKVGGSATNPQNVLMDDSVALPGCTIIADANINLTARGAILPNAIYSTPAGTGTILPPSPLLLAPVAVSGPPTPISYPCRIPAGSTAVQVAYSSSNAGSIPTGVITATTQTGFSAGTVASGGGNLTASVSFPG